MDEQISQCEECRGAKVPDESTDELKRLEDIGKDLKSNVPLCCRHKGYKLLKLLMKGNNLQTFYIQKGYESEGNNGRQDRFHREHIVINLLKNFSELYLSKQERIFFAFAVFNWLITQRYDLKEACRLLVWIKSKEQKRQFNFPLYFIVILLLIISVLFFSLTFYPLDYYLFVAGLGFILLLVIIFYLTGKMELFYTALHLLVPRLAITIMVGYLFILSANRISEFISSYPTSTWLISLLIAVLYLRIEMTSQLNPQPGELELWLRILFLILISMMWALLIGTTVGFVFGKILIDYSMPALVIGIILESVWQEKTITEPI
jgi:hypothetical protein